MNIKLKTGNKGIRYWMVDYFLQRLTPKERNNDYPIHIMLCVVDHFEPFHNADFRKADYKVKAWLKRYPEMADKYKDSDGKVPQHTWFYPPHYDKCFLKDLVDLCKRGYGEIEMHLHHNRMEPFPDTPHTLRYKITKCIEDYSKYGIFCLPEGTKRFAFIHGDWSLDNSCGEEICGVNNEIQILKECGCYADFTFPSLGKAQPAMINKIYYAKDDPGSPKSYNRGIELKANDALSGDLLMVPGIIGLRWKSRAHRLKPSIEASSLDFNDKPSPDRIDYWVKNAISINGIPNWKFIKLHTHGDQEESWNSLFGSAAETMHGYLQSKYNDGRRYALHYVTAREMYNIIMAAQAGKNGNPDLFRDFEIKKYIYLNGKK